MRHGRIWAGIGIGIVLGWGVATTTPHAQADGCRRVGYFIVVNGVSQIGPFGAASDCEVVAKFMAQRFSNVSGSYCRSENGY